MEGYRKKSFVHSRRKSLVPCSPRKIRLGRQKSRDRVLHSELEVARDEEPPISDSESSSSSGNSRKIVSFNWDGLVKLEESDPGYGIIKTGFLLGMGPASMQTNVVSIHKNSFEGISGQARLQSFRVYSEAVKKKCGGGGNVKFSWYGTSKGGVDRIVNHGFDQCGRPENNGLYGYGIYLSPHRYSLDSAMSSTLDENGLRHVLLCRVILGNMEVVHPGSQQSHPCSKDFDCGVDNLMSPTKYIVWSTAMNTHILPEYVISFKAPPCLNVMQKPVAKPKSPWMPFPTLISVLSKFIPPQPVSLIEKHHMDYQEKKISRQQLIQHVRQVAGDKLLISVIKSFRGKITSVLSACQGHAFLVNLEFATILRYSHKTRYLSNLHKLVAHDHTVQEHLMLWKPLGCKFRQ